MVRIEGYVSKKTVRRWLDNYQALQAGDLSFSETVGSGGGPKAADGVSDSQLNKLMLDEAIKQLPPVLFYVVRCRWIEQLSLKKSLRGLGKSKSQYYRYCDKAVIAITYKLNGKLEGYKKLVEEVLKD